MEQNPYAPSKVNQVGNQSPHGVTITPTALAAVKGTQFWVKLIGVGMFILVALQLLGLLMGNQTIDPRINNVFIEYIIPIFSMGIYCVLATRLLQYGKAISRLAVSNSADDFETAMDVQAKYWKLLGIMIIVLFIVSILMGFFIAASLR